ncbi:hypothetical protein GN958_ATG16065 [Phytophthora infestans]|uniref:Uncharacterized protein n=1 Tax=Phytophthora infestans TaxID=4787 RepID=A0A8S9U6G1_PHYIN|nr:hypothetical protein GN958_ATG16065 [Phytophthora infestans]
MATLEELIAVIDCSNESVENVENGTFTCVAETKELRSIQDGERSNPVAATIMQKKPPQRRRKRVGWSSSTGLQRRKRTELQFLRQHAMNLETYLQQLKVPPVPAFAFPTMATRS